MCLLYENGFIFLSENDPDFAYLEHCIMCWEGFLVGQSIKNLLAMQEAEVWSLGQEDPQEKKMATHSSILAQEIPAEEPGRLQSMELQKS